MMPPKHHKHQAEDTDSWLMSYADMITLLLGFFIIFVSVSEPKKDKLHAIRDGVMAGHFGVVEIANPFQGVYATLQGIIEARTEFDTIALERSDKSVTLEMSTLAFFQPGIAEFEEGRLPILEEIVEQLKSLEYLDTNISIMGHTSNQEVISNTYPTNWELSAARAARMVRYFIEQGVEPKRLRAVGYGDSQPKVPNTDVKGAAIRANQEQNERLVIKVERAY